MKILNCKGPCLNPPGKPVEIKLFSEGNSIGHTCHQHQQSKSERAFDSSTGP